MTLGTSRLTQAASSAAPYYLSIVRIVVGLMFMEHGTSKLFAFPVPGGHHDPLTLLWFAAVIETVGGALLTLGLMPRLAAFVMSGEMAVGYFMGHAPKGFFPVANGGDAAILYCLIFLYFALAGGGPWAIAALFGRPADGRSHWHSAHAAR